MQLREDGVPVLLEFYSTLGVWVSVWRASAGNPDDVIALRRRIDFWGARLGHALRVTYLVEAK